MSYGITKIKMNPAFVKAILKFCTTKNCFQNYNSVKQTNNPKLQSVYACKQPSLSPHMRCSELHLNYCDRL